MTMKRGECQWISDQPTAAFGVDPTRLHQVLEVNPEPPLPFGWEKCSDLQTGVSFFKDPSTRARTTKDPRVHVKLLQHHKDEDSEAWGSLSKSFNITGLDPLGDQRPNGLDKSLRIEGFERTTIDEEVSKWNRNLSSKKLPPLLSLKSTDSLPSLELSLRLESPHARDSSSLPASLSDNVKPGREDEIVGHIKLEKLEQCRQYFLGPNYHMGPFPSNSTKVKEESISGSFCRDQSPVVCSLSTSGHSPLEQRPEFRDLLGSKYAMGPFATNGEYLLAESMSSPADQLAGACTLDKVVRALKRTQAEYEKGSIPSVPTKNTTQTSHSLPPSGAGMMPKLPSYPLRVQPPSTKVSSATASLSPTTSDASSTVSSKSSLHSSPSGMSFQGEELDDLEVHGSSGEAKPQANVLPSTSIDPNVEDGEEPITLVAVGCRYCHMFVMLSKDNTSCPKCGSADLLDIPLRKRQKKENSPVDA